VACQCDWAACSAIWLWCGLRGIGNGGKCARHTFSSLSFWPKSGQKETKTEREIYC